MLNPLGGLLAMTLPISHHGYGACAQCQTGSTGVTATVSLGPTSNGRYDQPWVWRPLATLTGLMQPKHSQCTTGR